MSGDRDSDMAVKIVDEEMEPGRIGGQTIPVGRFCHSLRMTLWKEHLGIKDTEGSLIREICDPLHGFSKWKGISRKNAAIYQKVFPFIPQNSIKTVEEWKERVARGVNMDEVDKLEEVRGQLIKFSPHFLEREDLTPSLKNPFYAALDLSPITPISMAMFY